MLTLFEILHSAFGEHTDRGLIYCTRQKLLDSWKWLVQSFTCVERRKLQPLHKSANWCDNYSYNSDNNRYILQLSDTMLIRVTCQSISVFERLHTR